MNLWRRILCRLFHRDYHYYVPIYHSYSVHCNKCGHRWTHYD